MVAPGFCEADAFSSADGNWLAPSDDALLAHNAAQKEAPDPCRALSSSSTAAGSGSSSTAAGSDDDSDEELPEVGTELLVAVEKQLEVMNEASDAVNDAQGALKACLRRRRALERAWDEDCVHIARAIGMDLVAQAMPYFQQQQRCKALLESAKQLSQEFLEVVAETQDQQRKVELALSARLDEFRAAEKLVLEEEARCGITRKLLKAVNPFFQAEAEFRRQQLEATRCSEELEEELEAAKKRYRSALDSLEALSEEEHRQRGTGHSIDATSSV